MQLFAIMFIPINRFEVIFICDYDYYRIKKQERGEAPILASIDALEAIARHFYSIGKQANKEE